MNPTKPNPYKYGDQVLNQDGTVAGIAKFDPNTGQALVNPADNIGVIDVKTLSTPIAPLVPVKATPDAVDTTLANTALSAGKTFSDAQTAQDEALAKVNTQETNINDLLAKLSGESADVAKAQEAAGVNKTASRLREIQSQVNAENAMLSADILGNENQAIGTGETRNFLSARNARASRESAITSLRLNAEASILQGNLQNATALIDQAIKAKYEPMKSVLAIKQNNLDRLDKAVTRGYVELDKADQKKFDILKMQLNKQESDIAKQEAEDSKIKELVLLASKNGAPQDVISKINTAKNYSEALSSIGNYSTDPLERRIKEAQLNKINQDISIDRQNLALKLREVNTASEIPQAELQAVASKDPVSFFADVIKSNKIKGSATLESLLGVIEASKNLAETGKAGGFKGAAPIKLTPGFLKGPQQLSTQGQINAINLKVQQWASGAALTDKQTKQVEKFTPDKNDTDKQIKAKLNNLTNFMLSQGKSSLANQGVNIELPKVDLFSESIGNSEDGYIDVVTSTLNDTSSLYDVYGL